MKRILTLLLALLLALALLPASAEENVPEALYRIVLRTETGDVPLGSAVLFQTKTTLLTARGCWAEGNLYAIGADGEHAIAYRGEMPGSALLLLGMATESAAEPLNVTTADYLMDYNLYGVNAAGEFAAAGITRSRNTVIDDAGEVLLHTAEALLPGAIMLGDDGGLACLTVWEQAEGQGVQAAIADVTLRRIFPPEENVGEPRLLTGVTLSVEDGELVVDWSASTGYVRTESTVFTVYTTVTDNLFMTTHVIEDGRTMFAAPALPGKEMMAWVAVSQGALTEDLFPEESMEVCFLDIPEAEPFTLHGFTHLRCGFTVAAPGLEGTPADFLPQSPLTRETLSDPDSALYFQTEDVYQVEAEEDEHLLIVALYTPEGYVFYYQSGYVFMPEMNGSDLWAADVTELRDAYERFCEGEPWPAGEYTLLYLIDGGEAGRVAFTLE